MRIFIDDLTMHLLHKGFISGSHDYRNPLLVGIPNYLYRRLQMILNQSCPVNCKEKRGRRTNFTKRTSLAANCSKYWFQNPLSCFVNVFTKWENINTGSWNVLINIVWGLAAPVNRKYNSCKYIQMLVVYRYPYHVVIRVIQSFKKYLICPTFYATW